MPGCYFIYSIKVSSRWWLDGKVTEDARVGCQCRQAGVSMTNRGFRPSSSFWEVISRHGNRDGNRVRNVERKGKGGGCIVRQAVTQECHEWKNK